MTVREKAIKTFKEWYASLPTHKVSGGPARGTVAAALVVLERLAADFDLDLAAHTARGGAQVKGLTVGAVADILARFGETRPFLREGGRTNRGARGDVATMLSALRRAGIDRLPAGERAQLLADLQECLVQKVRDFHARQRLKVAYDPSATPWQFVHDLLSAAHEVGKEGAVAQHLVGAKLQLRFGGEDVASRPYSAADKQAGQPGDFLLGDTAFHVTVAPTTALLDRCEQNLEDGLRAFILVPDDRLLAARQMAEAAIPKRVAVESIESFVARNIEELSAFSKQGLVKGLGALLVRYNARVEDVETDKSLLLEIPKSLEV
jgi:hypothetical protein